MPSVKIIHRKTEVQAVRFVREIANFTVDENLADSVIEAAERRASVGPMADGSIVWDRVEVHPSRVIDADEALLPTPRPPMPPMVPAPAIQPGLESQHHVTRTRFEALEEKANKLASSFAVTIENILPNMSQNETARVVEALEAALTEFKS